MLQIVKQHQSIHYLQHNPKHKIKISETETQHACLKVLEISAGIF